MRSSNGVQGVSNDASCVSFSGKSVANGQTGYQFSFKGCDLSATGGIGSYSLSVTGPSGFAYSKSATLASGSIKLNVSN